jgi:hypothetical protein
MTTPPIDDIPLPKGAGRLPPWWMLLTPHETVDDWMILVEKKAQQKAKTSKGKPASDIALTVNQDNDNDDNDDLYVTPSTDKSIRSLELGDLKDAPFQMLVTKLDASADGMHKNNGVDNTVVTRGEEEITPSHLDINVENGSKYTSNEEAVTAIAAALGLDVVSLASDSDETRDHALNNELPVEVLLDDSTLEDTVIEEHQDETLTVDNVVEETLTRISMVEKMQADQTSIEETQTNETVHDEAKPENEMTVNQMPVAKVPIIESLAINEHVEATLIDGASSVTSSPDESVIEEVSFGQMPLLSGIATEKITDKNSKDTTVQSTTESNSGSECMIGTTEVEGTLEEQSKLEVRLTLKQITESDFFNEIIVKEEPNIKEACIDTSCDAATIDLMDNNVSAHEPHNVLSSGIPYVMPDAGVDAEAFSPEHLRHIEIGERPSPSWEHQAVPGQHMLRKADVPSRSMASPNASLDDTSSGEEVKGMESTKEEMVADDQTKIDIAEADDTLHAETKSVDEMMSEKVPIIEVPIKTEHVEGTLLDGVSSDTSLPDEAVTGEVSTDQIPLLSGITTEKITEKENAKLTAKSMDEPLLVNEGIPNAANDSDNSLVKEIIFDIESTSNHTIDVDYSNEIIVKEEPNIEDAWIDTSCDAATIDLTDNNVSAHKPHNVLSSGTPYVMPDASVDAEAFGPEHLRHIEIGERPSPSWEHQAVAGQHLLKKAGQPNKIATSPKASSDYVSTATDRRDHPMSPSEATGDAGAEARKADSGRVVAMAPKRRPRVFETAFTGVSPFDFAMQQRAQEKARREKERLDKEGLSRHHAQVVLVDTAAELKKKHLEELRQKKEADKNLKKFKNDHGPSQFDTAGNLKKLDQEQKKAKKEAKELNHGFHASQSFVNRK